MEKFLSQLLGTTDVPTYLAGFVFALIGAIVSLWYRTRKRNKRSGSTPFWFSWRFLAADNIGQFIVGFLITFLAFRFCDEFLGLQFTMKVAAVVGLCADQVADIIVGSKLKARKGVSGDLN